MPTQVVGENVNFSLAELLEAAHVEMLMRYHATICQQHPTQKRNVVGFAPGENFMVCAWCKEREKLTEPIPDELRNKTPPADFDDWLVKSQPWIHRLLLQLEVFYKKHLPCFPDPRYGKPGKLIAMRTKDGIMQMADHVHVGKRYRVFPNTMRTETWGHQDHPGVAIKRLMVWVEDDPPTMLFGGKWLPWELLEIDDQVQ